MSGDTCCIRVFCRVRPLNTKERNRGSTSVVSFPARNAVAVGNKIFQYDHVFPPESTQEQVYSLAAQPLVKDVLSGYNATIFAYGQTSSGKTHTMEGEIKLPNLHGVIPRVIGELFEQIYAMDTALEFHIKVSYFEIYMEKIRDLLDVTKINLPVHENKSRIPYFKGVTERFVTNPDEIMSVIDEGKANRHVSVTNMNAHSSRSHAVFLVAIKQENKETRQTLTGKLYLVDLAGSEKVDKTDAQGLTLDEAKAINRSLLALSNVISSLSEGTRSHIPYRDSKLTRVLQESLGGNARTTLVICCSPSSYNEAETKSTLQFGERAKSIKNKVAVNMELTADEWRRRYERQKEENEKLRQTVERCMAELTRWRAGEAVSEGEQVTAVAIASNPPTGRATPSVGATMATSGSSASLAASSAKELDEERQRLYQQLDDKDEEIHEQTKMMERLTLQVQDMEETLEVTQEENVSLKEQIGQVEQEVSRTQEELREVMQALEELAVSYEGKDQDIASLNQERLAMMDELDNMQRLLQNRVSEVHSLEETIRTERRKNAECVGALFRDLAEMGAILGAKADDRLKGVENDVCEEDFTRARIQLSNIRVEARSLSEQRNILEAAEREAKSRVEAVNRELNQCRAKLSQFESQTETLQANLDEVECQKANLENTLSSLNEQLHILRGMHDRHMTSHATGTGPAGTEQEKENMVEFEELLALQEETELARDVQQRHVSELKAELVNRECQLSQMQQQLQRDQLAHESVKSELFRLQLQQEEYTLLGWRLVAKEQAELKFSGLTETANMELAHLAALKQTLAKRLLSSREKANDETTLTQATPKHAFLEKNLDELTRAHNKLVADHTEMKREVTRLGSMLEAKTKRIRDLEALLKSTREAANREYHRLQQEREKTRLAFMTKLRDRERTSSFRRDGPTIVRPVQRPKGVESVSSREALLAVAGVHILGHAKRSPLLVSKEAQSSSSSTGDVSPSS